MCEKYCLVSKTFYLILLFLFKVSLMLISVYHTFTHIDIHNTKNSTFTLYKLKPTDSFITHTVSNSCSLVFIIKFILSTNNFFYKLLPYLGSLYIYYTTTANVLKILQVYVYTFSYNEPFVNTKMTVIYTNPISVKFMFNIIQNYLSKHYLHMCSIICKIIQNSIL